VHLTCPNRLSLKSISGTGSDDKVSDHAYREERYEGQSGLLVEQLAVQHSQVTYPSSREATHHRILNTEADFANHFSWNKSTT
jgi:hypothetical protein